MLADYKRGKYGHCVKLLDTICLTCEVALQMIVKYLENLHLFCQDETFRKFQIPESLKKNILKKASCGLID